MTMIVIKMIVICDSISHSTMINSSKHFDTKLIEWVPSIMHGKFYKMMSPMHSSTINGYTEKEFLPAGLHS